MQVDKDLVCAYGGHFGTTVLKGKLNSKDIAIKRIVKNSNTLVNEALIFDFISNKFHHSNICHYYRFEQDLDF